MFDAGHNSPRPPFVYDVVGTFLRAALVQSNSVSIDSAFATIKLIVKEGDSGKLPPGWGTTIDPVSKDRYYWDLISKETTWHRPYHPAASVADRYTSSGAGGLPSGLQDTVGSVLHTAAIAMLEDKIVEELLLVACAVAEVETKVPKREYARMTLDQRRFAITVIAAEQASRSGFAGFDEACWSAWEDVVWPGASKGKGKGRRSMSFMGSSAKSKAGARDAANASGLGEKEEQEVRRKLEKHTLHAGPPKSLGAPGSLSDDDEDGKVGHA